MEALALLNQDLGQQSGFNIQGAFKTSYHSVLDDLKTCRVCKSMPEYTRVCQSMPEYAIVCQGMP